MPSRKENKRQFVCSRLPHKGDAANNSGNQTRQYHLDRYATQAPNPIIECYITREVTEKDRWSVVGCTSTEPTNTSYPITTHTPNVQLTRRQQSFPQPFRKTRKSREKTAESKPKPHKRETLALIDCNHFPPMHDRCIHLQNLHALFRTRFPSRDGWLGTSTSVALTPRNGNKCSYGDYIASQSDTAPKEKTMIIENPRLCSRSYGITTRLASLPTRIIDQAHGRQDRMLSDGTAETNPCFPNKNTPIRSTMPGRASCPYHDHPAGDVDDAQWGHLG